MPCAWMTQRKRSHSDSTQLTDKWGIGSHNVASRQLLCGHCRVWQLYTGMDYDYIIDVVVGSKACIARYSAVQVYITALWTYYRHI